MALGTLNGSDASSKFKTLIFGRLRELGSADGETLGRDVFRSLTGRGLEEVDWSEPANREGFKLWRFSFEMLVDELLHEGHVTVDGTDARGRVLFRTGSGAKSYAARPRTASALN